MPIYVVFLGPPGSGKGTQARIIEERLGIPQVSTGELFRAMKAQDTPLARKVQEIMAAGHLVSDEVTLEVLRDGMNRKSCRSKGAVFDGYPRNPEQARTLDSLLAEIGARVSVALLFDAPREVTIKRIMGRARKEGRADDSRAVAEERYQVYLNSTEPLIGYYRDRGLLSEVNAEQPIEAVTAEMMSVLDDYLKGEQTAG